MTNTRRKVYVETSFVSACVSNRTDPKSIYRRDASRDGLHVAIAALNKMDHILSWNVQHLANPNKREHLAIILARLGMMAPEITTPDLLWNR